MPWNWDLENYFGDEEKDWMRHEQLFYPEDIATLITVQEWEITYDNEKIAAEQQQQGGGRNTPLTLRGAPFNPGMFQSLGRQ